MSDNWEPTGRLRFVERAVERVGGTEEAQIWRTDRILQQEWRQRWGSDTGPGEWRDVPVEAES